MEPQQKAYLTIKQFVSRYPWPSESALRAIIQKAEQKGFSTAIKRFYRRVLIDPQEFFACLERIQVNENGNHRQRNFKARNGE
jgi:hypothetical protein